MITGWPAVDTTKNGPIEDLPASIKSAFNDVLLAIRAVNDVRAQAAAEVARKAAVEKKRLEAKAAMEKKLQDERTAKEAATIAMAYLAKHGGEPPQKTAAQLEEENKEIEDLSQQAANDIDSGGEDDDSTDQVTYSADDIVKPPPKTHAGRKPQGALTKSPKGLFFAPGRWQDAALLAQCDKRITVHQLDVLVFLQLEENTGLFSLFVTDAPYGTQANKTVDPPGTRTWSRVSSLECEGVPSPRVLLSSAWATAYKLYSGLRRSRVMGGKRKLRREW